MSLPNLFAEVVSAFVFSEAEESGRQLLELILCQDFLLVCKCECNWDEL